MLASPAQSLFTFRNEKALHKFTSPEAVLGVDITIEASASRGAA